MSIESASREKPLTPFAVAMVICDAIWTDPYTGKCTVIGTFSTISGRSFPLVHPILSVYFALTDGKGKQSVRMELVDAEEERAPILNPTIEVILEDPRTVFEGCLQLTRIEFPEAGEYRLKLFSNEEFLMERRIIVVAAPAGER